MCHEVNGSGRACPGRFTLIVLTPHPVLQSNFTGGIWLREREN